MASLRKTNPGLAESIVNALTGCGFRYCANLRAKVSMIPNAGIRSTMNTFFSSTKAIGYLFEPLESDLIAAFGVTGTAATTVGQAPQKTLEGVAAGLSNTFTNPLFAIFQLNIWIRVAEVGLGVVLIAIGLAKLAPSSAIVKATPIGRIARSLT